MALRERNVLVVRAQGAERAHAVALHVHVRPQDLESLNSGDEEPAVQHLLALLDADAAFQALVGELDRLGSSYEPDVKGKAGAEIHQLSSHMMKAQWQLSERTGLSNVLERAEREEGGVLGGAYRPLPMRKAAVTVWMYPPTVVIPPTGEPIPKNAESKHDFLPSDSD